jgi:hypothetical protein
MLAKSPERGGGAACRRDSSQGGGFTAVDQPFLAVDDPDHLVSVLSSNGELAITRDRLLVLKGFVVLAREAYLQIVHHHRLTERGYRRDAQLSSPIHFLS